MDSAWNLLIDLAIILIIFLGIRMFRRPESARWGNLTAAFALLCALTVVLYRDPILTPALVLIVFLVGSMVGWFVAMRVNMVQIPAMVAFQHGAGGVAAFLVSFVELIKDATHLSVTSEVSGIVGLIIGAATFSGSMVAGGKLANRLKQTPTVFPRHNLILSGTVVVIVTLGVFAGHVSGTAVLYALIILILFSIWLGVVFSIRIGGADMPVLISFLNATAGVAAAFCGIIIQNRLLIACGATVAASGSILTHVMCKAMNRNLWKVFVGIRPKTAAGMAVTTQARPPSVAVQESSGQDLLARAIEVAKNANRVIIIPGYGMALAQAQLELVGLAKKLEGMNKEVKYAIHPVAGRMPGHMNVLLAEAEVEYDKLCEMEQINPEFAGTDLVLIVGACDVVNPAAINVEGTPISGMPILKAHEAKHIVVCNLDRRPGYSGVENPLYADPKTILLLGDARMTLGKLSQGLA
ncbi:MAG: NAD(P)(+) transhydrogenase (Re/Si-specific) subunit beta [Kiritimatiellae bacterium]|nr:NAD(P)(+) transhydrogenase (Re/Si-specific) subunit beta [Kiritimatiellia bacterium]MDD5523120.1 NAD(P)(+) transhydrogenase (Re/Si-specific) subunit beta [Kiritimatiellia bacterium]